MKKIATVLALSLLTACGSHMHQVSYSPRSSVQEIVNANQSTLSVRVKDLREDEDYIGRYTSDSYGLGALEQYTLLTATDIEQLIQESLELELERSGFKMGNPTQANVIVEADLKRFYFDHQRSEKGGQIIMNVTVSPKDSNNAVYDKKIKCRGDWSMGVFKVEEPMIKSLECALNEAIQQLVDDQEFLAALLNSDIQSVAFSDDVKYFEQ